MEAEIRAVDLVVVTLDRKNVLPSHEQVYMFRRQFEFLLFPGFVSFESLG